jgi:hypothetical protein
VNASATACPRTCSRANVACDVALISIPADEALLRTLCVDNEIHMLGEDIPKSPGGGGH